MFKGGSQASGYFKYPWKTLTCSHVWEPLVYNEPGCELAARDIRMTRIDIVPMLPGLNPSKGFKQASICDRGCQLSPDLISPSSKEHMGLNFPASFEGRWSHRSEFWPSHWCHFRGWSMKPSRSVPLCSFIPAIICGATVSPGQWVHGEARTT